MNSLPDLKKELAPRLQILARAKQFHWNCQYMSNPYRAEELILIQQNELLHSIHFSFAITTCTELSKLYGDSSSGYSLRTFLDGIAATNNKEITELIGSSKLDNWQTKLKGGELTSARSELNTMTDMLNAMAEDDQIKQLSKLLRPFQGIQVLIQQAEEILLGIHASVFQQRKRLHIATNLRITSLLETIIAFRDRPVQVEEEKEEYNPSQKP